MLNTGPSRVINLKRCKKMINWSLSTYFYQYPTWLSVKKLVFVKNTQKKVENEQKDKNIWICAFRASMEGSTHIFWRWNYFHCNQHSKWVKKRGDDVWFSKNKYFLKSMEGHGVSRSKLISKSVRLSVLLTLCNNSERLTPDRKSVV